MNQTVININDLTREENMKLKHDFAVGDRVLVNYDDEILGCIDIKESHVKCIKDKHPYFVVALNRDCDGTPLYTLSMCSLTNIIDDPFKAFCMEMYGRKTFTSESQLLRAYGAYQKISMNGINGDDLVAFNPEVARRKNKKE